MTRGRRSVKALVVAGVARRSRCHHRRVATTGGRRVVRGRRRGHFVLVILVEGTHVSGVMGAGQRVVVMMMVVVVRVMVDRTEPAGVGSVRLR